VFYWFDTVVKAPQRLPSDDRVRKIVKEEGRTARNLVTWNVPLEDQGNMAVS